MKLIVSPSHPRYLQARKEEIVNCMYGRKIKSIGKDSAVARAMKSAAKSNWFGVERMNIHNRTRTSRERVSRAVSCPAGSNLLN